METTVTRTRPNRRRRERWIVAGILTACVLLAGGVYGSAYGPAWRAYWSYAPQEGDILFQSLPRGLLVNAIEGVSGSPYSHCAIVSRQDGEWVVYEAYRQVEVTPLREFLFRGRERGFVVYRLKAEHQPQVPAMIEQVQSYLGRPYDARYRLDEERIYCSELIFKSYRDATDGQQLGKLVRLGDLNWQPYESTIQHFEGGPVPLEREMITPKELALSPQLELVFRYNLAGER